MKFALNHVTVPRLHYKDFLDLAARLGCIGVEVRNNIARPLFDGLNPGEAGRVAKDTGVRLLGLSEVYAFNSWDAERSHAVRSLISTATAAGAETISLIPRNDGTSHGDDERRANLRTALEAILPMLRDAGIVALVEPLGFRRSSLRSKTELIEAINSIDNEDRFRLVHDTFHHALAGGGQIYPAYTGIVHVSGVSDPTLRLDEMEDEHRVLVDEHDQLGNIAQLAALFASGYDGAMSWECFSPVTQSMEDPYTELKRSFEFVSSRVQAKVA
ncbi:MAG: TIM barrel protein [Rhodobacteraceae bacterium]|nr:TIM barrel protein [Paracoccaceae bacterium]MCY4141128.1 TIM barrel protein [Paracoccaceae bacterium]